MMAGIDADAIRIVVDNRSATRSITRPRRVYLAAIGPGPRFTVEDRGPGIRPTSDRIFEPFARGRHDTDRAAGTDIGLGLAICSASSTAAAARCRLEDRRAEAPSFTVDYQAA